MTANSDKASNSDYKPPSRLAEFLFLKPTLAVLLTVGLLLGGIMAYFGLAKESLPDLEIPQALITTTWAGADPESIEQSVTEPLELELRTVRDLKKISSASYDSYSIIALEFEANAALNESMQRLRTAVDDALPELPEEADRPSINQVSVSDLPIMGLVLYGRSRPEQLARLARNLQDRLEETPGVNEVEVGGLREEIVAIRLMPERLLELSLSPAEVADALRQANVDMPWGQIDNSAVAASLRLYGRFRDLDDLRSLPVTRIEVGAGQRIVRLSDIAEVERTLEPVETRAFYLGENGEFSPSVDLSVKKSPGADTIKTIEAIMASIDAIQTGNDWPSEMQIEVTQNQSEQIWDALGEVFNNAWQAMLAVFVILMIMLTWREGMVAGLSIALTFFGAMVVIWALGYTLNELVIIGMVIALGLMVDVFILMMEGLHEGVYMEGHKYDRAAMSTVRRYAIPAAAGQATTILALAPLMAISGVSGKFIRVLPVSAIACLVCAFIIAILIDIPLSRGLFRHADSDNGDRQTRIDKLTERYGNALRRWAENTTLKNRKRAWLTAGAAGVAFILSTLLMSTVPVVMYPASDGLNIGINVELSPTAQLEQSQQLAEQVGGILADKPYIDALVMLVGKKSPLAGGSLTDSLSPSVADNFVGFSITLKERSQRDLPGYEIADDLREEIETYIRSNYAGADLQIVAETGEPTGGDPIQLEITGSDMDTLRALSSQVQNALRQTQGTVDVRDSLGDKRLSVDLVPNREAMDFYNINQTSLASQVQYAMSDVKVGEFDSGGIEEDLDIRMGIGWPSRNGRLGGPRQVEELSMVRAYTPSGETLSLSTLLDPKLDTAAVTLLHSDGKRAVTVLSKTADRPVAEILAEVRPEIDQLAADWPAGYSYAVKGEAQETAETFASAGAMLVISILLVFAVLVLLFGSFAQSLVIIVTLPLALIGTFLGFGLLQMPFSFFAMVGVIALIGIVVNDAIVMIDVMNTHLNNGVPLKQAAARGAADRLRPILSTSLTTIAGLIPLAIANPMWRPLCFAVIFGLIASTVLTLVVVPALYMLLSRNKAKAINETASDDRGDDELALETEGSAA